MDKRLDEFTAGGEASYYGPAMSRPRNSEPSPARSFGRVLSAVGAFAVLVTVMSTGTALGQGNDRATAEFAHSKLMASQSHAMAAPSSSQPDSYLVFHEGTGNKTVTFAECGEAGFASMNDDSVASKLGYQSGEASRGDAVTLTQAQEKIGEISFDIKPGVRLY